MEENTLVDYGTWNSRPASLCCDAWRTLVVAAEGFFENGFIFVHVGFLGHSSPFCFHALLKPTEPATLIFPSKGFLCFTPSPLLLLTPFPPPLCFFFFRCIQSANTFYEPNFFSHGVYRFGGRYWFASLDLSHHSLPLSHLVHLRVLLLAALTLITFSSLSFAFTCFNLYFSQNIYFS